MEGARAPLLAVCGSMEILPSEGPHAGVQAIRAAAHVQVRKAEIQTSALVQLPSLWIRFIIFRN